MRILSRQKLPCLGFFVQKFRELAPSNNWEELRGECNRVKGLANVRAKKTSALLAAGERERERERERVLQDTSQIGKRFDTTHMPSFLIYSTYLIKTYHCDDVSSYHLTL